MTMKLHCFGESGNAYKAALALELSGLDWTPVYVDFFNGAARTPEYRETINAMGEVPGLQSVATAIATPCRRNVSIGGTLVSRMK